MQEVNCDKTYNSSAWDVLIEANYTIIRFRSIFTLVNFSEIFVSSYTLLWGYVTIQLENKPLLLSNPHSTIFINKMVLKSGLEKLSSILLYCASLTVAIMHVLKIICNLKLLLVYASQMFQQTLKQTIES